MKIEGMYPVYLIKRLSTTIPSFEILRLAV